MYEWAELRHFRYLLAILERQGFRAAAEELHTAQPNLSVQARQFQENASVRLFRKMKGGRIRPTDTGVAFKVLARFLLQTRDEVLDALIAIERGEIGSVRFGCTPLVDQGLFQTFCELHNEILPVCPVRPTHGDTAHLAEEVVSGTVDAAFVTLPLRHPDLHIQKLRRDRLVVCLRRDHPLGAKAALQAADLQGNLAVLYHPQRHPDAHERLLELLRDAGVEIEEFSCASHPSEMQTLVKGGHGLRGVQVFRETDREFATGDRIQMTLTNRELGVANRDLGTITAIENGRMSVRMDGKAERAISFDTAEFRQFDHGYAVTSHSSQGLTAGRVLAHFDTDGAHSLINTRLAYVAISRASDDARVYTNNAETLGQRLATDISKTAAVDFRPSSSTTEIQQAVAAFRANDPATGTAKLQEHGRVHEYANAEHRVAAVALAYTSQDDRAVVVAPDAGERRELTQLIRDELRQQGRLAAESRFVTILVEQHFGNPRLAANYAPGDEIHYRVGSLAEHGITDNSTATVLSVDARTNTLTVATRDGNETSYNPALLKTQTAQSTVYREEQRDLAIGERIRFTDSDRDAHIRVGNFATVERIGEDNALSVRLDNGKSIELDLNSARHIEYGYAADTAHRAAVDRVLVTGDASQLAQQQEAFTRLSSQIRDITLFTSDSRGITVEMTIAGTEKALAPNGISSSVGDMSAPEFELAQFGITR